MRIELAQAIAEQFCLFLFVHDFECLQINQQNAALNLSIIYFLAENNISQFTTVQPAFCEMIASAQQITRAPLAHRNLCLSCLKAAQAQSAKKPAQGVAPLKTRGFACCLHPDAVKSIKWTVNHGLQTHDGVVHVKNSTAGGAKKNA